MIGAGFLAVAALVLALVAARGDAGPFGFTAVLAGALALAGLVPATFAGIGRLRGRRSRTTGQMLVAALLALVVAVAAIPVGEVVRRQVDDRRAQQVVERLDAAARACAQTSSDPDAFGGCLERAAADVVDQLSCTPGACSTTLVHLPHARRAAVIVDTASYLDGGDGRTFLVGSGD